MCFERLKSIIRAGRHITAAAPQPWTNQPMVKVNQFLKGGYQHIQQIKRRRGCYYPLAANANVAI